LRWKVAIEPLQSSEENFAKATQESEVINAAAGSAAAIYGGPAGAAAYAAWSTYRRTGNVDMALRAGVLAAVTSQTGSSVAKLPAGTTGEIIKKAAVAGAAGGISVAAAGGDEQAIKDGFLKSAGAVLVQGGSDKLKAYSPNAKDAYDTVQCISARDVDCLSNTTWARDAKGKILDDHGKPRIDTIKLDPTQYIGRWTGVDPQSAEGKENAFITQISKLPSMEAIPILRNQWVLTWTLGKEHDIAYKTPTVALTYVSPDAPFNSTVEYSPDCSMPEMTTLAYKGTVRILSVPQGKLQRIVRLGKAGTVSNSDGSITQLYWAVLGLSPDGRWLAAIPREPPKAPQNVLVLADRSAGELRYLRVGADPGFDDINGTHIGGFAFSGDGRRIAAGLELRKGTSVNVLDSSTGAEIMSDRIAHQADHIVGLAFGSDGGLNLASFYGVLNRYGSDLKLRAHRDLKFTLEYVVDLAMDPSGQRVAVAYSNNTVSILDAQTLKPIAEAKTGDLEKVALRSITWSGDGATVVAALTTNPVIAPAPSYGVLEDQHVLIRRINASGQLYREDIDLGVGTLVGGIASCGDGVVIATGEDDKPLVFVSALGVVQFVPSPPEEAVSTGDAAK
jgi:WD40 repeat protein